MGMIRLTNGHGTVLREMDGSAAVPAGPALPCFRCGICCERWQPLLTPADAVRLAAAVGVRVPDFQAQHTIPYPFSDEERLLRRGEDGACMFLRWEEQGGIRRAGCAVHAARPAVCRDWAAGLDKKECVQGLARFASAGGEVALPMLYPDAGERAAAAAAFR